MGRFTFIGRRFLMLVPLLLGILLVVFLLLKITPGNPAREAIGMRASPAAIARAAREMGLDESVPSQFVNYVGRVIRGNLGYSFQSGQAVRTTLAAEAPVTAWLIVGGAVIALLASVPLAVIAAFRPNGIVDQAVRVFSVFGIALPSFWVGIMLITVVALPSHVFPVGGFGTGFGGHLRGITLPAITLGFGMAPVMIRSMRTRILEVLESEYVKVARSLGIGGWRLVRRFVVRNSLVSVITLLAIQASYFLFGAVVIETTFNLPGLGQGLVVATENLDFPLVQGYTLVFAVGVLLIYLVADIVTAALDPRVEISG